MFSMVAILITAKLNENYPLWKLLCVVVVRQVLFAKHRFEIPSFQQPCRYGKPRPKLFPCLCDLFRQVSSRRTPSNSLVGISTQKRSMLNRHEQGNYENANCFCIYKKHSVWLSIRKKTRGISIAMYLKRLMDIEQFIYTNHNHCCRAPILHLIVVLFQRANRNNVIDLPEFYLRIRMQ